jgi:branched-chain amino acid transport system permease protein
VSTFFQQLVNGLSLGSIYALIALGYTMVYGILRLINFAHGDVYMVGAYMGYYASSRAAASRRIPGAGVIVLDDRLRPARVLIERFAYRPVRRAAKMTSLITAIGGSLLLENGGQLVFGADPKFFPSTAPHREFNVGGVRVTSEQLTVFVVSIVLTIFLLSFIQKTRTGKAMRAVSFNLDAAKLMGISTDKIIAITFALGSAFAAAAGVLVAMAIPKVDPLMGIMSGLKAFVAAVLGGIGNVPGALIGGLIIGIAEVFTVGYLSPTYRDAIAFAILIGILLFRPQGILGRVEKEKV